MAPHNDPRHGNHRPRVAASSRNSPEANCMTARKRVKSAGQARALGFGITCHRSHANEWMLSGRRVRLVNGDHGREIETSGFSRQNKHDRNSKEPIKSGTAPSRFHIPKVTGTQKYDNSRPHSTANDPQTDLGHFYDTSSKLRTPHCYKSKPGKSYRTH